MKKKIFAAGILMVLLFVSISTALASYLIYLDKVDDKKFWLDGAHYNIVQDTEKDYDFYLAVYSDTCHSYCLHIKTNREKNEYVLMEAIVQAPNGVLLQEQVWLTKTYDNTSIIAKAIHIMDELERGDYNE